MTNPSEPDKEVTPVEQTRGTRRAFLKWGVGVAAGLGGIQWIRTRSTDEGIPWQLRRMHQMNEWFGRQLFSSTRRAREFSSALAAEPRVNGVVGALAEGQATTIQVQVFGQADRTFTVAELIEGLPRVKETTELKCIEGWSQIVTWGGVRFAEVAERLGIKPGQFPYVSLMTADRKYYVGLDAASAFHPQTLLCDMMNDEPLTSGHGGPLRLIIPVKYGIKNIKWIGQIAFLNTRPADYWAERGYDWFSGL